MLQGPPDSSLTDAKFKVHYFSSSKRQVFTARRLVRRILPTHVHFLNPMLAARATVLGERRHLIIGDWEDWHTNPENPSIRNPFQRQADRWFIKNADIVTTCSLSLAQEFNRRYFRNDVCYIPYASTLGYTGASSISLPSKTFVFMGSIRPHWNHRTILEAAVLLKAAGVQPSIIMIGDGADRAPCEQFVRHNRLSNVSFTGRLDDETMMAHLRSAHALLFPIEDNLLNRSRCPFKVFHYALARRPIITSAVGEVLQHLGDRAYYVPTDAQSFAKAILHHLSIPPQDIDYPCNCSSWDDRSQALADALEKHAIG
ncbi:Glycosyl transferases group 1 [Crateriforma conspicua]|uniref:Glycosyl transferases group 1 n=2 Tax=Crateriforma conspicua TaxID=2527996 RepID=A0A5C5Y6K7_9PLAN|nr:Glycosyl transferases group 1 [Crateriforma conspicua]